MFFNKILSDPKMMFVFTKYLTFGIYFFVSIILANKLGLFFFGVYGFIKLLMQYLSFSNLGVNYSSIVCMSQQSSLNNRENNSILVSSILSSFFFFTVIFVLLLILYPYIVEIVGNKYEIRGYFACIFIIVLFKQINLLFINVHRVYNKLKVINIAYLLPCLGELIVLPFASGEALLRLSLYSMIVSNSFVSLIFFSFPTFHMTFFFRLKTMSMLVKRGIKLLIYNVSFYFISMISKSYISFFFSVSLFAQYSFAYNISDAVMLLNNSISFLIYPTLLKKLSCFSENRIETINYMIDVQNKYMLMANLISLLSYIFIPLIQFIVPDYKQSIDILAILLLAQLFIANTFTMSTYLVQQNKEIILINIGLISISFLILLNYLFHYLSNNILLISSTLVISMCVYNVLVALFVVKHLNISRKDFLFKLLDVRFFIPIFIALCVRFVSFHWLSIIAYSGLLLLMYKNQYIKLVKLFLKQ